MYGFYSEKQSKLTGTNWYLSRAGNEVEVTVITKNPHEHGCKWSDIRFVAEVTQYLRSGREVESNDMPTYTKDVSMKKRNTTSTKDASIDTPDDFDWNTYNNIPHWKI